MFKQGERNAKYNGATVMKLKSAAIIATVIVIVVGAVMISPLFFRPEKVDMRVMLSFSVVDAKDAYEWCENLSSILNSYDLPATVFVVGEIAQQHPQTVTCFNARIDIGSQTYSKTNLTCISDYTEKLQEVQGGKSAVDAAGSINSQVFQAPFGATDQDIYSLLNRSGILADFSYSDHYNVYRNEQFEKYSAIVFDASSYSPKCILGRAQTSVPTIIQFNNTLSTSSIQSYLSLLVSGDFEFVNASELTGLTLTSRGA